MFTIKQHLDAVDPRLFFAIIALLAWLFVYSWRRLSPGTFEKIPPSIQGLPAILFGAIAAAPAGAGNLKETFVNAAVGAFSGLASVGVHHVLKESPVPYTGQTVQQDIKDEKKAETLTDKDLLLWARHPPRPALAFSADAASGSSTPESATPRTTPLPWAPLPPAASPLASPRPP